MEMSQVQIFYKVDTKAIEVSVEAMPPHRRAVPSRLDRPALTDTVMHQADRSHLRAGRVALYSRPNGDIS